MSDDEVPTYEVLPHEWAGAERDGVVPPDTRCLGCRRRAGKGKRYGPNKLQWDRRAQMCGPCFDAAYQGRLFVDPGRPVRKVGDVNLPFDETFTEKRFRRTLRRLRRVIRLFFKRTGIRTYDGGVHLHEHKKKP